MSSTLFINPSAMQVGLEVAFLARSKINNTQMAAFERFAKIGFPNRKVEGWKWSDFDAVMRQFDPAVVGGEDPYNGTSPFKSLDPLEFRIIDGQIQLPEEKLPEGVRYGAMDSVGTIPELETHPIAALNVSMARKALGMEVGEGVIFPRPIHIRHINNNGGFCFVQTMLRMAVNSKATIIETYEGEGIGFYSHLFHLVVRDGAALTRSSLQESNENSTMHTLCAAKVERDAQYNQSSLSTGGRLARHETHIHFWGERATAAVNSAALVSGDRHCDFTSDFVFKNKACKVRQLHKGVARDRGRNVFQGKFHVERSAQKTDAKMTANALLLSETAEANHKPELEIYADDVECAHGATSGALDNDALFYLMQRGLPEESAKSLLTKAFLGEALEKIDDDVTRDVFGQKVDHWLENL